MTSNYESLVSVIIPSYNHADFIDEAIKSVFDQEYKNWELIICDDGSTDNSKHVLEKYRGYDRVTLMLNEKNRGQGVVLNEGICASKGQYICFLSSDDVFLPHKISVQLDKFAHCSDNVGFIYTYGAIFSDDNEKMEPMRLPVHTGDIFRDLIVQNFIFPISPMFRRSVFDVERFWDDFAAEGEAIFVRVARHYHAEFVPEITCAMRRHTYNTGRRFQLMYSENLRWWRRFADTPGLEPDVLALIKRRIAYQHRLAGLSYIRMSRQFKEGRSALLKALQENKEYFLDWKVIAGICISMLSI